MKDCGRIVKRLRSFVCLITVAAMILSFAVAFFAYEVKTGTMNIQPANQKLPMRADAGSSSKVVGYIYNGEKVQVIGEKEDSSGVLWYRITCTGITGYVRADFVDVDVPEDAEYEKYLESQGFPESYRVYLRRLHYYYPEWEFIAVKRNLDWEKCIDAEYSLGVSLVDASSPSSWKSTQSGAYNWTTSSWTSFDYGLHAASREIIAYYLDPRNSLDRNAIFQFLGQGFDEAQTVEGVERIVSGTFLSKTVTDSDGTSLYYPQAIYNAGKEANVNPYVIAAKIKQEIGTTETGSVSGTVSGYENIFNFYNILAYAHDGRTAIENGLIYAAGSGSYGRPWNTRYKGILGGALWFNKNYGKDGSGTFYNNRFAINDNYTLGLQYMTNVGSSLSEGQAFALGYPESARNTALKFYIPVYENMPETACEKPTGTGSPNNKLSSLTVSGYSVTPTFNTDTYEYSLIVPSDVSSVDVSAISYASSAKISGTGKISLEYGANEVNVAVTAENGSVRTYTVIISRETGETGDPEVEMPFRESDGILRGVEPETTVADFLSAVTVTDGTAAIVGKNQTGTVATGDVLAIYCPDGSEFKKYTVVIMGDVSGDGKIMINDIVKIRNHLLSTSLLGGTGATAADVSGDGLIMINDIVKIRNYLLGTGTIAQ